MIGMKMMIAGTASTGFCVPVLVLLLMPTGLVEAIEHRQDILNIFGIGVRIVKGIEQRVVLGTQLCLNVMYPLKQRFSLLAVFLLSSLNQLPTEALDLASRCAKAQCGQVMTELRVIPFMDDACCKA